MKQIKQFRINGNGHRKVQWGKAAGAFALGATAGSVAALLLAPASGKVLRRRIGSKIFQAERLLAKRVGDIRDATVDKLGETRQWLVRRVKTGSGSRHLVRHRS